MSGWAVSSWFGQPVKRGQQFTLTFQRTAGPALPEGLLKLLNNTDAALLAEWVHDAPGQYAPNATATARVRILKDGELVTEGAGILHGLFKEVDGNTGFLGWFGDASSASYKLVAIESAGSDTIGLTTWLLQAGRALEEGIGNAVAPPKDPNKPGGFAFSPWLAIAGAGAIAAWWMLGRRRS